MELLSMTLTHKVIMKKLIILSLCFTGSILCRTADPIPTPTVSVQTLNSVQSMSGYFLKYVIFLLEMLMNLHAEDRELIRGAFVLEAQKDGYFPSSYDDCNTLAIRVIKAKVFNEAGYEASKWLYEPGPTKIANSLSGNVEATLKKNGIHEHFLVPYMGSSLRQETQRAAMHPEYAQYRIR
jgi:hypothetical protein